jgi:putative ABC transport system permease protein
MSILKLAFRNVSRHRRRSFTIAILIAAGTALFVVGNAVFANADRGIKASFIQGFTGDFSISAKADDTFSLFGNEVPIVGEYATPPPLQRHDAIADVVRALPGVKSIVSVVSGAARLDIGGWHDSAIFFGVAGPEYAQAFPSISVVRGAFLAEGQPGLLLNASQAAALEKASGRKASIGDLMDLTVFSDAGFTIRSVPLRGIFSYATRSAASDRICLVDVETARSLNGYIVGSSDESAGGASSSMNAGSVDDLFSSNAGDSTAVEGSFDLASVEKALGDTSERSAAVRTASGAWNFILVRADGERSLPRLRNEIEKALVADGDEARVLDWRGTAGSQAQMVYLLRMVFNIGIIILAFAAVVIIMNSLVISVLERAGEIGMMRAIGASRSYVCRLFVAETMSVTLAGALAGLAVGSIAVALLSLAGIRLSNPLLITMFGDSVLRPSIGLIDAFSYLAAALLAGATAWIYPVRLVLKSQPVQAMSKAEE